MSHEVEPSPVLRVCSCLTALPDLLPGVTTTLSRAFGPFSSVRKDYTIQPRLGFREARNGSFSTVRREDVWTFIKSRKIFQQFDGLSYQGDIMNPPRLRRLFR